MLYVCAYLFLYRFCFFLSFSAVVFLPVLRSPGAGSLCRDHAGRVIRVVWRIFAILFEILGCSCLLGCSVPLSFGVAALRICIRSRRSIVSGVKRVGRSMRPTCSLAVDQELETHCARLVRVSMRLVAGTADGHTASNAPDLFYVWQRLQRTVNPFGQLLVRNASVAGSPTETSSLLVPNNSVARKCCSGNPCRCPTSQLDA